MSGRDTPGAPAARTAVVLLCSVVALQYGWTCGAGFINDDYGWVEQARAAVSGLATPVSPIRIFLRPVIEWSFRLNYLISGSTPVGYHLVNVLLEMVNTLLVWRLAGAVLVAELDGLLVALLFAAHPAHAGAVTWVCGRTELIAAAAYLAATLLHLQQRAWSAAALFAVALLSRESAISFPLVALLLDRDRAGIRVRPLVLYSTVLMGYLLVRRLTETSYIGYAGLDLITRGEGIGVCRLVGRQLIGAASALLEPLGPPAAPSVGLLLGLVVFGLWTTAGIEAHRAVRFGSWWMVLTVLPFLGWTMFVPRYAYLPSLGLTLVLVGMARGLVSRYSPATWSRVVVAACLGIWCITATIALQRRNETLWRNGTMSGHIVAALAQVVPQPAPGTVFVVDGLGPLRLGRDPSVPSPVFVFGLSEAVRLRFADATLDAAFPNEPLAHTERPTIRLRWDAQTGTFIR